MTWSHICFMAVCLEHLCKHQRALFLQAVIQPKAQESSPSHGSLQPRGATWPLSALRVLFHSLTALWVTGLNDTWNSHFLGSEPGRTNSAIHPFWLAVWNPFLSVCGETISPSSHLLCGDTPETLDPWHQFPFLLGAGCLKPCGRKDAGDTALITHTASALCSALLSCLTTTTSTFGSEHPGGANWGHGGAAAVPSWKRQMCSCCFVTGGERRLGQNARYGCSRSC